MTGRAIFQPHTLSFVTPIAPLQGAPSLDCRTQTAGPPSWECGYFDHPRPEQGYRKIERTWDKKRKVNLLADLQEWAKIMQMPIQEMSVWVRRRNGVYGHQSCFMVDFWKAKSAPSNVHSTRNPPEFLFFPIMSCNWFSKTGLSPSFLYVTRYFAVMLYLVWFPINCIHFTTAVKPNPRLK